LAKTGVFDPVAFARANPGFVGTANGMALPTGSRSGTVPFTPAPQRIFGIPGTPSFGDIVRTGISLIPGAGPVISTLLPRRGQPAPQPTFQDPRSLAGGGGACIPPFFRNDRTGLCELDIVPGQGGGGRGGARTGEFGDAVVGQFGVGLQPAEVAISRSVCPTGMQLGKDGLCYNRGVLTNRQRLWPRARAPLLTGGERNAITKAAAAGRKLERASKQLQKIGLMKKPTRRTPLPRAADQPRRLPPGTTIVQN